MLGNPNIFGVIRWVNVGLKSSFTIRHMPEPDGETKSHALKRKRRVESYG